MTQPQYQPIFILPEGSQRTTGKSAQRTNIMAAKLVAETVRTTLGPKGMDKMLVDSLGDVTITNDGVTILEEMSIEHPSAKMIVEVAKTQEDEVGDGTTTAVVLAGELLKNAESLLDMEIHPTVISRGYRLAGEKSQQILNEMAEDITEKDTELLKNIAITAMTGKGAEHAKEKLAELAVKAVISVLEKENGNIIIDKEDIKIEKKVGGSVEKSGATVVICQKGIDDIAQHYLAKKKIYSVRRVKKSDLGALAKATGARIITNLDDLYEKDLGKAGIVEEKKIGDEQMTYIRECKNAKAVTLLIRGGTEHVVDEIKRAMEDAVGDIIASLTVGKIVAGAGATEIELARQLRQFSESLSGREQLAVKAFADAVEIIPRTLAENSGLDPIDVMTELKAEHDKGNKWAGVNVFNGKTLDAWKQGIIEPLKIKTQAISSSSEVAEMILRIDDVIASSGGEKGPSGMPPGGMPEY